MWPKVLLVLKGNTEAVGMPPLWRRGTPREVSWVQCVGGMSQLKSHSQGACKQQTSVSFGPEAAGQPRCQQDQCPERQCLLTAS